MNWEQIHTDISISQNTSRIEILRHYATESNISTGLFQIKGENLGNGREVKGTAGLAAFTNERKTHVTKKKTRVSNLQLLCSINCEQHEK